MNSFKSYKSWLLENQGNDFYHGSTDKNFAGKRGIHVGTYKACKEALEARIGVPAKGEWDGTREYGKTLLAGKNSLAKKQKSGIFCQTGFNCGPGVPDNDYYPTDRKSRASYSDGTEITFDCKPIIFKVRIVGQMTNSPQHPYTDDKANTMMMMFLKKGNARSGYYYINDAEDYGSISAVVPNGSFLRYG